MKHYAEALVARLRDPSQWPGLGTVEHFEELQKLAGDAKNRATTDGYLAAMLIIHQITEETIKVLIDDAHFFTQLRLYPLPIELTRTKKGMFGQYLFDLKATVWFQNKKYIVEKAESLNTIRKSIVHGLTRPGALAAVERDVTEAWKLYSELSFLALEAHMVLQSEFKDLYQDSDWPPKDAVLLRDDGSYVGVAGEAPPIGGAPLNSNVGALENSVMEMETVERYRRDFAGKSDEELHAQMHQWAPHSEMHLAAKLLLQERHWKQERHRFHLIFWPALVAALASVLALFF